MLKWLRVCGLCLSLVAGPAGAAITREGVAEFDRALEEAGEGASAARQRLAVRRVIRDAQKVADAHAGDPSRFLVLEFLFRAQQRLIALDDDAKHRGVLLEICRELVKAPDEYAGLRLEADLLLSQAELAKKGANAQERAQALRPFIERYVDTPAGKKVLRIAMVMALELGDNPLVNDIREMIKRRFPADLEMIAFQRDKLGGQVFGAPFAGTFKRSDGKVVCFPMDLLGRVTMLLFWSREGDGLEYVKGIAAASLEESEMLDGRLEIISINLDDLPDAGESMIRGMGVDWQVLHLPGGRDHPAYHAYVRTDPLNLRISPSGQAALVMNGVGRRRVLADGTPDYKRMFGSSLARSWSRQDYVMHLQALTAGEFLVLDPQGGIDPKLPIELQAAGGHPLQRNASCVPQEMLREIQSAFVMPPQRYRLGADEVRDGYARVVELCRKAMAAHPQAKDLWIVRNRLVTALLGLWKVDSDLAMFDSAVGEAKAAIAAGYPDGCDVIARFCLARAALRDPAVDPGEVIDRFVVDGGGEGAAGPVHAAALLLALDVADRARFESLRKGILDRHTEQPSMWMISSFLLDRYHDYWLFQVPFTAGWSYGRREGYFMSMGDAEPANRLLQAELVQPGGTPFRVPADLDTEWTVMVFSQPAPWAKTRDDGLPPSPHRTLQSTIDLANSRPQRDIRVVFATLGGDPEVSRQELAAGRNPVECPVVALPGGIANPLVQRLGFLAEDRGLNSVLLRRDGSIATFISGLAKHSVSHYGNTLTNVVVREDEKAVVAMLERGEVDQAKQMILGLCPPYDPEAVDERGRKLRQPMHHLAHLRARARVYMAVEEWDKALADAEEVVTRQLGKDGGMSLRTDELDESEALRNLIRARAAAAGE